MQLKFICCNAAISLLTLLVHLAARTLLTLCEVTILGIASLLEALASSFSTKGSQIDSLRVLLI